MAAKKKTLTKKAIPGLRYDAGGKSKQILYDKRLAGFGVRVYPAGRNAYVRGYGTRGSERMMTLGPATSGDDLEAMREHAQDLLRKLRTEGLDPMAERRKAESGTVAAVVTDYIEASNWSEAETKRAKSRLKNHMAKLAAI